MRISSTPSARPARPAPTAPSRSQRKALALLVQRRRTEESIDPRTAAALLRRGWVTRTPRGTLTEKQARERLGVRAPYWYVITDAGRKALKNE